jgi:RNA polymerase sigma-70 factor (ECF subfamily)
VTEPSDEELVHRFVGGERGAFDVLVARHERRVYNLSYRMLGRRDDALDATQETFLACYRKLGGFRGQAAFTTWLHRVALNICYDALRRRSREETTREDEEVEPAPVADPADASAAAVDVRRALLEVPEDFRAVLILHDVQGFLYEEIAEAIGVPVGTVKSRLHRGRVALARALRGERPGPLPPSNPQERITG